jgi:hypothetical protein
MITQDAVAGGGCPPPATVYDALALGVEVAALGGVGARPSGLTAELPCDRGACGVVFVPPEPLAFEPRSVVLTRKEASGSTSFPITADVPFASSAVSARVTVGYQNDAAADAGPALFLLGTATEAAPPKVWWVGEQAGHLATAYAGAAGSGDTRKVTRASAEWDGRAARLQLNGTQVG